MDTKFNINQTELSGDDISKCSKHHNKYSIASKDDSSIYFTSKIK